MIRLISKKLIIPRGDTGSFSIPVLTTFNQADVAVFSIIDTKTQKIIFRKTCEENDGILNIIFTHYETVNLPIGKYYWDIKSYKDAEFVDGQLVNGTEVDSYYAAYSLPICQVRQTGDKLLTENEQILNNDSINLLSNTLNQVNNIKNNFNQHFSEEDNLTLGRGTINETTITPQQLKALLALLEE